MKGSLQRHVRAHFNGVAPDDATAAASAGNLPVPWVVGMETDEAPHGSDSGGSYDRQAVAGGSGGSAEGSDAEPMEVVAEGDPAGLEGAFEGGSGPEDDHWHSDGLSQPSDDEQEQFGPVREGSLHLSLDSDSGMDGMLEQ